MTDHKSQLADLSVPVPCRADWDKMSGDEQSRHCTECKLNVYNLSAMTKAQAEKLLESTGGNVCVRFYRRPDGTVLTRDCSRIRQSLTRARQKIAAVAATVLAFFNLSSAFAQSANGDSSNSNATKTGVNCPTMGEPLPAKTSTKATSDKDKTKCDDSAAQTKSGDTTAGTMLLGRVKPMTKSAVQKSPGSNHSTKTTKPKP